MAHVASRPLVRAIASAAIVFLAACDASVVAPTAPVSPAKAPPPTVQGENRVLYWGEAAIHAIRIAKPAPTVAARVLAVVHTAIFDAWAAYDSRAVGTRLGGSLRRPVAERTQANKEEAISYAAYRALVDLFPAQKATFDAQLAALGHSPANATMDPSTPAGVGNAAAAAVIAYRRADGSNQANGYADVSGYVPVNTMDLLTDASRWQPLPTIVGGLVSQKFATPHWQNVTPFALLSGRQYRPFSVVARWGTKAGDKQIDDVIKISAKLTDEDKAIAEYWADGPSSELPPGHWCMLAKFVSKRDRNTLDDDAKMYFVLANALLDASIAAWDAKRTFDTSRPITQIRVAMRGKRIEAWGGPGKGKVTMMGEQWMPYQPNDFVTPPFAEFTSGHSTFSAAAATVLQAFTGSDSFGASVTIAAGSSRVEPGLVPKRPVTLTWKKLSDAAEQAGESRLLGGIHFAEANDVGQRMGKMIGAQAWLVAQGYISGVGAAPGRSVVAVE